MVGEAVVSDLKTVIKKLQCKGAIWEWAIYEKDDLQRLHFLKITLSPIAGQWRPKCLFSKFGLSLFRGNSSLEEVMAFIEYCLSTRREHDKDNKVPVNETGFPIGQHKVKLFGNFTREKLDLAKTYGPLKSEKPFFFTQYALHDSVRAQLPYDFSLLGANPPFINAWEAYKYYFDVDFGETKDCWAGIVIPVEIAYITNHKTSNKDLIVELQTKMPMPKNLYLSVVCRRKGFPDFRKRMHVIKRDALFDIGFQPTSLDIALYLKDFQIDHLQSFDRTETLWREPLPQSSRDEQQEEKLLQHKTLFSSEFLEKYSREIRFCLEQTEKCCAHQLWVPASLMLRKALDLAVNLKMKQIGKQKELYTEEGCELPLPERLRLLANHLPSVRRDINDILRIKWFGDKGAHSRMEIYERDVRHTIEPHLRAFLTELDLKNSINQNS